MADNEEDMDDTLFEEPQPSPDQGHGLEYTDDEESRSSGGVVAYFSFLVEISTAFVIYTYIFMSLLANLIIPASFTPLVTHQQPPNTTDATQLMKDICQDGLLMLLFVLQHSLMRCFSIEAFLDKFNMASFSRAVYTLSTCLVLHVIHWLWKPIANQVWHCPDDSTLFLVVMATVHVLCWSLIGFSLFITDYLELLGIKQLYCHYKGLEPPLMVKSRDQRQLYANMRHPVFLSPIIILWFVPTMTYDRLLVAIMTPLYLIWGSGLTDEDEFYVYEMYSEKKRSLTGYKRD